MKNECLWGVDNEFKILMRKAKPLLKQTTPLQICSAPFLNSPEGKQTRKLHILTTKSHFSTVGLYSVVMFKITRQILSIDSYCKRQTTEPFLT